MTNEDIIFGQAVRLLREGVIKGTGKFLTMTVLVNGKEEERSQEIPEAIHTFAAWKEMGFSVKKGEHAIAKFPVWKFVSGTKSEVMDDGLELKEDYSKCIMKTAAFFAATQVEPIKAKA